MLYLLFILNQLCRTIISGAGVQLTFSIAGIYFLGFPTIFTLSAYGLAISQKNGLSPLLGAAIAMSIAFVFSLIFAKIYQRMNEDTFTVICVASIVSLEALVRSWESLTNGTLGISGVSHPVLSSNIKLMSFILVLIATIVVTASYFVLKSKYGRILRAHKEDKYLLATMGVSSNKLSTMLIVTTGVLCCIQAVFVTWQIQFVDPKIGGLLYLVELLTVGILAVKPQARYLLISAVFVTIMPELLRYLNLPSSIIGYSRNLLYSTLLIVLIFALKNRLIIKNRSI